MGRWVVWTALVATACTRPNPYFHTVYEDESGGAASTSEAASTSAPEDPATSASGAEGTSDGVEGGGSSGEPPDPSTSSSTSGVLDTGEPGSTSEAAGSSSGAGESSSEAGEPPPGPCEGVCGTENCGACPDGDMILFPGLFWIDAVEASNANYAKFLEAEVSKDLQPPQCAWNDSFTPTQQWPPEEGMDAHPVVYLDWCDAHAYCAWSGKQLCGKIGGGPAPFNAVVDPNKNQWYRACNAGIPDKLFPYPGPYNSNACNGEEYPGSSTVPVGSIPTCQGSLPGLFDISGNVWEWTDACVDEAPDAACQQRGGSYFSTAQDMQCNIISDRLRHESFKYLGVRCCKNP